MQQIHDRTFYDKSIGIGANVLYVSQNHGDWRLLCLFNRIYVKIVAVNISIAQEQNENYPKMHVDFCRHSTCSSWAFFMNEFCRPSPKRAELPCGWNKQKSFTLGHTKAKLLQKDFLVLSLFHAYYYYLCVIKKTFKLLSVLLFRVWKDEQPRNESVVYGFLWLQFVMGSF